MALLFQCSCSVRGSVDAFLLILVALVSSGHAQNVRVMLDQDVLIGLGTLSATCVDMDGNPSNQQVTWSFADASAVLPEGTNFSISGQNSETIVLRVTEEIIPGNGYGNPRASIYFRCATQGSISEDASVDLYRDLCRLEYLYCFSRFNYAVGSATCTSRLSNVSVFGTPVTSARYDCTCLAGSAGAPCRSVRDCVANASDVRDRLIQCGNLFPELLSVTPSSAVVFSGSSVTFNCTSVLPITSAGVNWTVPPELPRDSLRISGEGGNTLTIDPVTADLSGDSLLPSNVIVSCSASVVGTSALASGGLIVRDLCTWEPDACQQYSLFPPGSAQCVSSPFTAPHCDCLPGTVGQDCRGLENCASMTTSAEPDSIFLDCARDIGCTLNEAGQFDCNSGNTILPSLSMLAALALSTLFI